MLIAYGFDIGLLCRKDLNEKSSLVAQEHIVKSNISRFNAYASLYNRCNKKHPVKVKDAQSMIQVMYKDVSAYLPNGIDNE